MCVMAKGLVYQIIDRNCSNSKTIEVENRSGAKTERHKVMKELAPYLQIYYIRSCARKNAYEF